MAAPGIRLARIDEASALSALCVRSKASWGYDEVFMALARVALEVSPEQIAAATYGWRPRQAEALPAWWRSDRASSPIRSI
jgi:hypothetical protein